MFCSAFSNFATIASTVSPRNDSRILVISVVIRFRFSAPCIADCDPFFISSRLNCRDAAFNSREVSSATYDWASSSSSSEGILANGSISRAASLISSLMFSNSWLLRNCSSARFWDSPRFVSSKVLSARFSCLSVSSSILDTSSSIFCSAWIRLKMSINRSS